MKLSFGVVLAGLVVIIAFLAFFVPMPVWMPWACFIALGVAVLIP